MKEQDLFKKPGADVEKIKNKTDGLYFFQEVDSVTGEKKNYVNIMGVHLETMVKSEKEFKEIKEILQEKCIHCEAFPITLVLPEEKREDPETVMNTRLTNENFQGEILERFNSFMLFLSE